MKDQKLKIECGRCGKTMSEILTKVEARTIRDGIGPVFRHCDRCEKRPDGSKPPPNVTRRKGRHNTRLRRGQRVGRVMIGLSHKARSDWRRRPSATKWRPCCTNTTQFKRKMRRVNDVMRVSSVTAGGQPLFQWRRRSRRSVIASRTRPLLERHFWSWHARSLHREFPRKGPPPGVAAGNRPRIRRPAPESAALYYRSGTHTLARRRPGARPLPPNLLD